MTRCRTKPAATPGVEPRERRDARGTYWVFRVRWIDPATGRRLTETCDTLDEALDFKANLRLLQRRGSLRELDQGRETVTELAGEWFADYAPQNIALSTARSYLNVWRRHLEPRIGHHQLRAVTPKVIEDLKTQMLNDGVGAPTVYRALALLSALFRQAVVWDRATTNPVRQVRKPSTARAKDVRALTIPQVESALAWLTEHRPLNEAALVVLMAYTGARPQDALALTWADVTDRTVHYRAKNVDGVIRPGAKTGPDRQRTVSLLPVVAERLSAWKQQTRHADPGDLVVATRTGQPWPTHTYKNWQRGRTAAGQTTRAGAWPRAAAAAGVTPGTTPYALRHTWASLRLAEQRLSLQEVAEELGHSVDVLARTYAHVISDLRGQGPVDLDQTIRTTTPCPQNAPTKETT